MIVHECAVYHVVLVRVATTSRDLPSGPGFPPPPPPSPVCLERALDPVKNKRTLIGRRALTGIPNSGGYSPDWCRKFWNTRASGIHMYVASPWPCNVHWRSKSCCACGAYLANMLAERLPRCESLAVSQRKWRHVLVEFWRSRLVRSRKCVCNDDVWNIGSVSACLARWHCHRHFFFWRSLRRQTWLRRRRAITPSIYWASLESRTSYSFLTPRNIYPQHWRKLCLQVLGQWRLKLRLSACLVTSTSVLLPFCFRFAKGPSESARRLREKEGLSAATLYVLSFSGTPNWGAAHSLTEHLSTAQATMQRHATGLEIQQKNNRVSLSPDRGRYMSIDCCGETFATQPPDGSTQASFNNEATTGRKHAGTFNNEWKWKRKLLLALEPEMLMWRDIRHATTGPRYRSTQARSTTNENESFRLCSISTNAGSSELEPCFPVLTRWTDDFGTLHGQPALSAGCSVHLALYVSHLRLSSFVVISYSDTTVVLAEDVLNKGSPITERRVCNNGRGVSTETSHSNGVCRPTQKGTWCEHREGLEWE